MSPVPNRPQPSKAASVDSSLDESASSDSAKPVEDRPKSGLMRPVARPAAPAAPQVIVGLKSAVSPPAPPPEPVAPPVVEEPEPEGPTVLRPIPAPSEPMQYRAIGLVRGTYKPEEEQFTKGVLVTEDGTEVEAVLLGRVMSLVKNHLSLEKEHVWVVYPRTRERECTLHLQIVGVWEPENLSQLEGEAEEEEPTYQPSEEVDGNYFSIRGEVVFYSPDEKKSVVKIQQIVRKKQQKEEGQLKAFKLNLRGELPSPKTVGYFWDMEVVRDGQELKITSCTPVRIVPPKKGGSGDKRPRRGGPGGGGGMRRPGGMGGASRKPGEGTAFIPKPRPQGAAPAPKPVIKKRDAVVETPTEAPPES
jgi:hypothetical protein